VPASDSNALPHEQIMHVAMGNFNFSMIEKSLKKRLGTTSFTLIQVQMQVLNASGQWEPQDKAFLKELAEGSNYYWSNASTAFFLSDGTTDWGLGLFGMIPMHTKKLNKRQQEVSRSVEFSYRGPVSDPGTGVKPVTIGYIDSDKPEILYDGIFAISLDFAKRVVYSSEPNRYRRAMILEELKNTRLMGRFNCWLGTGKGDLVIIEGLPYDIMTHPCNVKDDLVGPMDEIHFTLWRHEPWHQAVYDRQKTNNFRNLLPDSQHRADLEYMVQSIKDAVEAGTDMEDFLGLNEDGHFDGPVPAPGEQGSDFYRNFLRLWVNSGLEPFAASHVIFMIRNAVRKKMAKGRQVFRDSNGNTHISWNRMWVPMRNAFVGGISAYSFYTDVCGTTFPGHDGTKAFWDDRWGIILPDDVFPKLAKLLGGADQDDTITLLAKDIFSSDPAMVDLLKAEGVLTADVDIPSSPDEAIRAAVAFRSPSAPGEWCVVFYEGDMPFWAFDDDEVLTFDLKYAPLPSTTLNAAVKVTGLPPAKVMSGRHIMPDEAWDSIEAQLENPGVGRYVMVLMAITNVTGGKFLPPVLLAALEDIVDCLQQEADKDRFRAIEAEITRLTKWLVDYLNKDPDAKIDRYFANLLGKNFVKAVNRSKIVDGRFSKFERTYEATYHHLGEYLTQSTFGDRAKTSLVHKTLMEMDLGPKALKWGAEFFNVWDERINRAIKEHPVPEGQDARGLHPFEIFALKQARSLAIKEVVDQAIEAIETSPQWTNMRILAVWKYIVTPTAKSKFGHSDRLLFQAGTERCLGHILIDALIEKGLATPYNPSDEG